VLDVGAVLRICERCFVFVFFPERRRKRETRGSGIAVFLFQPKTTKKRIQSLRNESASPPFSFKSKRFTGFSYSSFETLAISSQKTAFALFVEETLRPVLGQRFQSQGYLFWRRKEPNIKTKR